LILPGDEATVDEHRNVVARIASSHAAIDQLLMTTAREGR
jgi:hypothetical protein